MNLPETWLSVTIGEITDHVEKVQPANVPEKEICYLDISGIDNNTNRVREAKIYLGSEAPSRARQRVKEGDILFSTVRTYLKNIARVPSKFDGEIASTGFSVLRPSQCILSDYLFAFTLTPMLLEPLAALQRGSSYPAVRDQDVRLQVIPLPPLAEQKRIVAKIEELFSELDAGEESLRQARRQLGVYRQSLLKQAFEGRLTAPWRAQNPGLLESPEQLLARIQEERKASCQQQTENWEEAVEEWENSGKKDKRPKKPIEPTFFPQMTTDIHGLIPTPDGWTVELVGNCPTDSLIGLVRSAAAQHEGPSGFPYIKMDRVDMLGNLDATPDVFVDCTEEEGGRFALQAGDILFNTRNSVELVGKVGIVRCDPELPTVYNNNLMRIRLPNSIDPIFFGLQLCSQPFRQRMEKVKKATTSVAAIYAKDFWPLPIVVTSLPEQKEIVRLLDEQFEVIEQNEREIDAALKRSEALRQSILRKAFTGQLVPQDPADEPASTLLARIRSEREAAAKLANPKKKVAKKKAARKRGPKS